MIVDARTQKPIADASILISDLKTGTFSSTDGIYTLLNLPEGNHLLEVSHIGYATIIVNIFIKGNTIYNVSLTESIVENNEVIITGVSNATHLKKVPFQVDVLKKNNLLQNAFSNIIEAITKVPGVSSVSTGPAISKPIIRGLGYNRLVIINNGVRQEGQQWGDEHGIEIDEYSAGKIEVMKGMKEPKFQVIVIILLSLILITVVITTAGKKEKTEAGTKYSFMGKKVFESKQKWENKKEHVHSRQ
jgi:iron complex outermembrane receptor protein